MGSIDSAQLARLSLNAMSQLSLPNLDAAPALSRARPLHRLFFAALPPPSLHEKISQIAPALHRNHGICGRVLDAARLHVSLLSLGDFATFPYRIAAVACRRVSTLKPQSFTAVFDRVSTFNGKYDSFAIVLQNSRDREGGFHQLHRALANSLGARAKQSFDPHMTLLYARRGVPELQVRTICWTVAEFALVYSKINRGSLQPYTVLERWELRSS